jgi:FkbH-like protein
MATDSIDPNSPISDVVLAGTFTVDPLLDSLAFLLQETGLSLRTEVAPYGQVFQQLLDPSGLFGRNRNGVNVVLVRCEDWLRGADGSVGDVLANRDQVERNVRDLVAALRGAAATMPVPFILVVCPSSSVLAASEETRQCFRALENEIEAGVADLPNLRILPMAWGATWDPATLHDAERDRLGHVPYTPRFFAALALELARLVHALKSPSAKVLVLDCDNTLWKGVVGEDGVAGIEISERFRKLQAFVLEKKRAGMVLCLASKNVEADVLEVLDERKDMVLRQNDIVAMRINWLPKSENVRSLAEELNLGLDSFVFIDDNPVECAEVEAACPGVLVLQVPLEEDAAALLKNVWPLDTLLVTDEDLRRSDMYRQNMERQRFSKAAGSLASFLAGLELNVAITLPAAGQTARVSQLTQRTNQFNFTTRRRSEAEIERLAEQGLECRVVEVRDRFGDYGLVGVMVFGTGADKLVVDTFLLSCRVLGRGVEHAMIRELGRLAQTRGLSRVEAPFLATKKNLPARKFLESLEADTQGSGADGFCVVLSAAEASRLTYAPSEGALPIELTTDEKPKPAAAASSGAVSGVSRSQRWNRLARMIDTPDKVLACLEQNARRGRSTGKAAVPPRTATERKLCAIWADVLGVAEVGVEDDYTSDLGGTSLLAVSIFARIERDFGVRLPLVALVETPTIAGLASRIDRPRDVHSLVVLAEGGKGLPLFLVHDADGETLLYRNLAQRLGDRPVYGLQPHGRPDTPIVHTRIQDMAAHYVAEIRKVCAHGPYLLGGLCAGGIIAYEMALQFEEMGERAKLVAIFDAADVAAERKPNLDNRRRLDRVRQILADGAPGDMARALATKLGRYAVYQWRSRRRKVWNGMAVGTLRFCLDRGLPLPRWARRLDVRTVYNAAEVDYLPKRKVREEIVLFRASAGEGSDEPYVHLYADPLLGWGGRSIQGTRAFDVPGGHGSMLQEPHVAAIAKILRSCLDQLRLSSGGEGGAAA